MVVHMGMEQIRSILANNQSGFKNQKDPELGDSGEHEDSGTFRLAEILKTGYQTRKFSNTPTLNWLQTWRVSNLASFEPK
ncbi:MAG: hypothetical protein CML39_09580 [Rhodobacteraceae bacterium]|nr:MAG: hypothetical protein CML39_09580 [Paracoccaceae bacterium]